MFPPTPPSDPPQRHRSPRRWALPPAALVRRLFPLVAVVAFATTPTAAHAVEQGFIDVVVEGKGRVTGTQIDCPEQSCRGRYFWPDGTTAPFQRLTAVPDPGWALRSWGGCFDVPSRPLECNAMPDPEGSSVLARFADVSPPTLAMTAPADQTVTTPGATLLPQVTAADNDAVDRVEYFVDGALRGTATSAPWSTAVALGGLHPDGPSTLTAEAVDRTGNRSVPVSRTLIVDGTPPEVTIDGPPTVRTFAASHTFTFSATDAHLSSVTCTVTRPDGETVGPTPCVPGAPWRIGPLTVGTWTFTVVATDRVASQTTVSATVVREADPGPGPGPVPGPDPHPGPDPGPGPGPDPGPGPAPVPGPVPPAGPGPLPGPAPLPDPPGGPTDSGPGTPRAPSNDAKRCVVPKVARGTALKTAKGRLTRANCRVRTVRATSTSVRAGRVIRISPKAGRKLPKGTRITVTVARR